MRRSAIATLLFCFGCAAVSYADEKQEPIDIEFVSDVDGTAQKYVMISPLLTKSQPVDLLIALHGHGSDRWQFITQNRGETKATRDFAELHKMLLISPDYRAKTSWMGPTAEADLVQIIRSLKQKYAVRKVYLCGGSMGGSSALTFAVLHPDLLDGVASMNGVANHLEYAGFQDAITESFGGTKVEIPAEYKKRSAEYWPERLNMPIGIATGGKDEIVPPQSVMRLANILQNLQRPVLHIHRPEGGHSTTYEEATQILDFMLQKSDP